MHQIHVKLHYSAGLLVVRTNSKFLVQQSHVKVLYSGGLPVDCRDFKTFERHQIYVKVSYSPGILLA